MPLPLCVAQRERERNGRRNRDTFSTQYTHTHTHVKAAHRETLQLRLNHAWRSFKSVITPSSVASHPRAVTDGDFELFLCVLVVLCDLGIMVF